MENLFKVGDVVVLASGGPRMTVVGIYAKGADDAIELCRCMFFNDGKLAEAMVPALGLRLAEKLAGAAS